MSNFAVAIRSGKLFISVGRRLFARWRAEGFFRRGEISTSLKLAGFACLVFAGAVLFTPRSDASFPALSQPQQPEFLTIDAEDSDPAVDDDSGDDHPRLVMAATWTGLRPDWHFVACADLTGGIPNSILLRRPDSRGPPGGARRFPSCRRTLLAASLDLEPVPTHELERNPVS